MTLVTLSISDIISAPVNDVWNTLRAFIGNERFNPLVTSSKLEGCTAVSVGCKRICYVSLGSESNVLRTEEVLNSLDEENRTMTYTVNSAPGTPFEGLINKIEVIPLPNNECEVRFSGALEVTDDSQIEAKKKILDETYHKILVGLKNLHAKN